MAQENLSILNRNDIKRAFETHGIKTSAQKTAFRFHKVFYDGDEWYTFPRVITNENIHEAYTYHLNQDAKGFYAHLSAPRSPADRTQLTLIEDLQYRVRELEDDNMALSRVGWHLYERVIDMKEELNTRAEKAIVNLRKSFIAMGFEISKTAGNLPEPESPLKKILTEDDAEDLLSKYTDPKYTDTDE
jgi:hypothetical protein